MALHIHIHRTRDDETKHDPKNGKFTSGGGGGEKDPKESHTPAQRAAGKAAAKAFFSKGASAAEISRLKKGRGKKPLGSSRNSK